MFKQLILIAILFAAPASAEEPWAMILGYHRIVEKPTKVPDITITAFKEQMEFVKANYTVITLEHLVQCIKDKKPLEANSVVVTLDDGDKSIYTNALPVLKKLGIPATVFIYTDFPGKGGFSWEEAKKLAQEGMIIGSHTVNHVDLTLRKVKESPEDYLKRVKSEIGESKKIIEEKTGLEVKYFAYPFGKADELVQKETKAAGYLAAVGTAWDRNFVSSANMFNLKRRLIPGKYKFINFVDIFKNTNIDKSTETEHEDYR